MEVANSLSGVLVRDPSAGTRGKKNLGLQELAGFRGQSVDEVIALSVSEYLETIKLQSSWEM